MWGRSSRWLCDQLGLVYSPLLKFRRAQLEAVLRLGALQCSIPRSWWSPQSTPVLSVTGWAGQFRACGQQAVTAPSPLHFIALERVAATHWEHVEAKAEHGFNLVSYCLKFVNDRKCKFALSQIYPGIPARGFKGWRELTLHAISTHRIVASLRAVSETHVVLKQLTANYLAAGHEQPDKFKEVLAQEDVKRLEAAAALVEQMRARNDLFDVVGRVEHEIERSLEPLCDFGRVWIKRQIRWDHRQHGDNRIARAGAIGIAGADDLHVGSLDPQLLMRLAQRRLNRILAGIDLAAGEGNLPGVRAHV